MTRDIWNERARREFHGMRPTGERGRNLISRKAKHWSGSCWETRIFIRPVTPQPLPGFLSIIGSRRGVFDGLVKSVVRLNFTSTGSRNLPLQS